MIKGPSFEGIYYVHLQGERISQERNKKDAGSRYSLAYSLTLKMEAMFSTKIEHLSK
jgi:hypothetical protein